MTDPGSPLNNAQHSGLFIMKPFLSFNDQLCLLKSRHLYIKSEIKTKETLKTENYYRLSGYFKMYTKPGSDDFVNGFSFKKLMKIYNFDAELRILLDEYIARVEIESRTRIAYILAKTTSPSSYYDPSYFVNKSLHDNFMKHVATEIKRNSNNPMIKHFDGQLIPIWVIVEVLSFGTVSKMFSNLKPNIRKDICKSNDYSKVYIDKIFKNNLLMVSSLRNICAHHGRLYGRHFPFNLCLSDSDASLFSKYQVPIPSNSSGTPFHLIFALCNLMNSKHETIQFAKKLKHLFSKYKRCIDIHELGFDKNWIKLLSRR